MQCSSAFERADFRTEADPFGRQPGEINRHDGGRGVYWDDPNGHKLEIITRPYGSCSSARGAGDCSDRPKRPDQRRVARYGLVHGRRCACRVADQCILSVFASVERCLERFACFALVRSVGTAGRSRAPFAAASTGGTRACSGASSSRRPLSACSRCDCSRAGNGRHLICPFSSSLDAGVPRLHFRQHVIERGAIEQLPRAG